MYPRICPLWCSSKGGCHWVIISEFDLADPTKPKGGPDGAKKKKKKICWNVLSNFIA